MRKTGWLLVGIAWAFAGAAVAQVSYSDRPPPPPPPNYPGQYPGQYPGEYPGQPRPGYGNQTITCGSPQHRLARCPVPNGWRGVRMVRQTSNASCVQGRTWGYDRGGVWVNEGCAGVFAAGAYGRGGWQPGPGWNHDFTVTCGSPQYRYAFCQVDVGARGRVQLQRQTSDARCVEGQSWGWNRAGVWVDRGCSAAFLIVRRW
ncbi:MAG TPA: DUF3011 domain-containing protein [Rhodanobacteraceae bacterium]|jgi:hypothetical protein|nr:DUF3011 domain-containing protein [Rhodanobacteraceae bacterium]